MNENIKDKKTALDEAREKLIADIEGGKFTEEDIRFLSRNAKKILLERLNRK